MGTIFYFIDTVNNYEWNRWAIDFSNNILPKYSSHFPQLIPANWSISYVMIGEGNIHFFPKLIMPLFFLNNILIFLDLALTKKNHVYLNGLVIYGILAPIIFSLVFILDGNADIPVSFFSFMVFYGFIKFSPGARDDAFISFPTITPENKYELIRNYLQLFLFASMAAATKLAGAYIFTITSLILLIFFISNWRYLFKLDVMWRMGIIIGIVVFALFWYLRSPDEMISGLNQPQYLSPEGYWSIAAGALKLIYYNWGLPVCIFLFFTLGLSFLDKRTRYFTLIMVMTPFVIWIFKYSSDFRNLSFVIPYLSFSSGIGFNKLFDIFKIERKSLVIDASKEVESNYKLNSKDMSFLLLTITISAILLLYFISGSFYIQMFNVYNFIHKFYFLGYRVINFIEYDILLPVDFYQRTFIALTSIILLISFLILLKVRIISTVIISLITISILSSTIVDRNTIIDHQTKSFRLVEARNHYAWLETLSKNINFRNPIYTNFRSIIKDKIPRDLKFKYLYSVSGSLLTRLEDGKTYVFLKLDLLNREMYNFIKKNIKVGWYTSLFDDGDYYFIRINQKLD